MLRSLDEELLKIFEQELVVSTEELLACSGYSRRTIYNRCKLWQTYTSYSHNNRYHVLPHWVKFNDQGIWSFKGIYFSKQGTLKETIMHLVEHSDSGLSAKELSGILGVCLDKMLARHFQEHPEVVRQKINGILIYFSKKESIYNEQKLSYDKLLKNQATNKLPSDANAIPVLVELIKHPGDTPSQLIRRVRRRGVIVSIDQIRSLLQYHGLLKKKKLPSSSSFKTTH